MINNTSRFSQKFKGRVVFITGASSGIGEALARELACEGALLALSARRLEKLEELAKEISNAGGTALPLLCDVTRDGDIEQAIQKILGQFGRLDLVVANAGFGVVGTVEKITIDDYRRQFETNVFGVLRTVYATLSEIKKSQGQIVLMGSVASYVSLPQSSAYSMSKFSIRALADALTDELRAHGVSVTLLSPGFVTSEIRRIDNQGRLRENVKDPLPDWLPMPAQKAAKNMVKAIAQRKREEIITSHGKWIVFIHRHFPWIIQGVTRFGLSGRPEPL